MGIQDFGIVLSGVLTTAVGVVDQVGCWTALDHGHAQSCQRQLCAQVVSHGPAHHPSRGAVQEDGQVEPPLPGADVGDVAHPELVGIVGCEVALDQIGEGGQRNSDRGAAEAPRLASSESRLAHQPGHPRAGVEFAHNPEFGLDAGSAIGLPPLGVDGGDLRSEPNIGPGPLRLRLAMPLVVGGAGDQ